MIILGPPWVGEAIDTDDFLRAAIYQNGHGDRFTLGLATESLVLLRWHGPEGLPHEGLSVYRMPNAALRLPTQGDGRTWSDFGLDTGGQLVGEEIREPPPFNGDFTMEWIATCIADWGPVIAKCVREGLRS